MDHSQLETRARLDEHESGFVLLLEVAKVKATLTLHRELSMSNNIHIHLEEEGGYITHDTEPVVADQLTRDCAL